MGVALISRDNNTNCSCYLEHDKVWHVGASIGPVLMCKETLLLCSFAGLMLTICRLGRNQRSLHHMELVLDSYSNGKLLHNEHQHSPCASNGEAHDAEELINTTIRCE